ncbi:MAG: prolipoprotein diacylglyceryl transferase [Clostridia bacterium]|nr:MAG: prolipoprotein diacylglyceryl transferase [Clostridia bacterium]
MRRVLFHLGPLPLHTYGVMLALGVLAAIYVIRREARRKHLDDDRVLDFVFWALVLGILGARVGFIIFADLGYYWQNPLAFFRLQDGGLSIHGAITGGVVAGLLFARRTGISFWRLADVVAPGLALGIAIGRVGCDVFGRPMTGEWFWGVPVNGQLLHPAQVYEFLLDYLLFLYLWWRRGRISYDGQLFLHFVLLYAAVRGVVEFVRYNPLVWGPFSVAHVASIVFMLAAFVLAVLLRRRRAMLLAGSMEVMTGGEDVLFGWGDILGVAVAAGLSLALFYGLPPA